MKLKFVIIVSVIVIAILLYLFSMKCYKKLPEVTSYRIVSNTGQSIPAKLYLRTKTDNKEQVINELILCFNDSIVSSELNISGEDAVYKYLVIVPDYKLIGLVEQMGSLEEKEGYICQTNDAANKITPINNNFVFFTNPPIKDASFTAKNTTFNTYGILKQFGDSVIIEVK
ncbi:hypothetical protein ACQKLP_05525 [Chitinophaga sp. NPDC101104]|uniref:hypothetical protein n=1 Tax=Chitinophaga sp. NPDC101104 TaxID=3390561 RepID=UPI003D08C683